MRYCVTVTSLAASCGCTIKTVKKYLKAAGFSGTIYPADEERAIDAVKGIIANGGLTSGAKKGLLTADYLAEKVGTSHTTMGRYLREKGYTGRLKLTVDKAEEVLAGWNKWKEEQADRKIRKSFAPKPVVKKPEKKEKPVVKKTAVVKQEEKKVVEVKKCDWRVSIRGSYGWIVVRVGTQDEMEPWAEMLMRNGIEARASRNECRKVVNA